MDIVIVKEIICKPVDVVWRLVTELEYMRQWFFENIPSFEAKVGFQTEFNVMSNDRAFLHSWEIVEVSECKTIKYSWSYPEYFEQSACVTFYFNSVDEYTTELTIVNDGIDNYPSGIPEFTYESCELCWKYFINRLSDYVKSI